MGVRHFLVFDLFWIVTPDGLEPCAKKA